jgi:hypothetical protein
MKPFLNLCSSLFVPRLGMVALGCALVTHVFATDGPGTGAAEPFRPEAGKFPPL